jgi:hypothetical protein
MIDAWHADAEAWRIGSRARMVGELLSIERLLLRPLPEESVPALLAGRPRRRPGPGRPALHRCVSRSTDAKRGGYLAGRQEERRDK